MNELIKLQRLAICNDVSIFKIRKDRKGYTKTPLTIPQLKSRLTRHRISYKIKNKMNFGMNGSEPTFADLAADAEARWDVHEAPEEARVRRRARNALQYAETAAKMRRRRLRAEWIARRMRRQMGPASSIESVRKREEARAERADRAEAAESRARAELEIAAREWERDLDEDARQTRFGRRYKRNVTNVINNFGMMRSYAQVAREANETERLGAPVRVLLDRVLTRIEAPAQVTNQADLREAHRLIRMFPQASLESTRAQHALDSAERRSRDAWWERVERREDDAIDRMIVEARKRVESSGLPNDFNLMVLIKNKLESASSLFLENLASINPPGAQRKLQIEIMKYAKILRNLHYDISERLAFSVVVVNRRELPGDLPGETLFTNEEVKKVRDERSRFNNRIDIIIDELRFIPPNAFGLLGTQNVNVSEASNVDSFILNYSQIIRHYSLRIKDYVDDGLQEYSLEKIRDLLEKLLRRIFVVGSADNTPLVNRLFNFVS